MTGHHAKDASAVPENLYSYSDSCTHGAQQMQDFVRAALAPAIAAYERGGGVCMALDRDVASAVSTASNTDREVRTIGHAFQVAGSAHPMSGVPFGPSRNDLPGKVAKSRYTMSDRNLEVAIGKEQGADLASRMTTKRDSANIEWIREQLQLHLHDPFFLAGFYNKLSTDQIAMLMNASVAHGGDKALAAALASGQVSKAAIHHIAEALSRSLNRGVFGLNEVGISPQTQLSVLQALAASPEGARNFVDGLTQTELRDLMKVNQLYDNLNNSSVEPAYFREFFNMLSSAASTHKGDPQAMVAFMRKVGGAVHGMDLTKIPQAPGILLQFASLGMAGAMGDPGKGKTADELSRWVLQQSGYADQILAPFLGEVRDLINKLKDIHDGKDSLGRSMVGNILLNFVPWGKAIATGAKVLDDILIGVLQSVAGVKMDPAIKSVLGQVDGSNDLAVFAKFADKVGETAMLNELAKHGYIHYLHPNYVLKDGSKIPYDPQNGLSAQTLNDMLTHPERYIVVGKEGFAKQGEGNLSLTNLNRSYGGFLIPDDTSESGKVLTGHDK